MNENRATESSLPLPDNGRKIQVGDISFVYKNTYHPIYWVGDEPYRPRVETLVIRNGKDVFLRMYDTCEENSLYRYRLPGGSLDNDSTKEQQAENETNEEALLSLSEIHNTGLSYYHYYKDGKLLKGGDICIKYKGTISDIFIGKYKGKVDKSTIEKHDLDDDMATNGKFYPIIKVCQLLRPEHIEAILNSGLVDDNVKGSVRLILRGDKKTKIPDAPISENLETYLTKPKYIGKNILLYHGSPTRIDRIDPISCNNGTRISGFRMSSFWSDNIGVSIAFSLAQILNGTHILARFGIDEDGNAGLMVVGSDQQTVKNALQDKVIYIHKKSMPSKMVGRGHARGLQEFTLDIPVVPDEIDTLTYDDYCDYIHYITTDQYEKQKMLSTRKNRYVANSKDNIMEKILYYKKDELKRKTKEFMLYTKESNDIVTEGSIPIPIMKINESYIEEKANKLKDKNISYSKSFNDVKNIADNLSKKDLNNICDGDFKNSPYVIYREVLLINKEPAAFIDVYNLFEPDTTVDGCIVVACKSKYRGMGLTRKLVNRMIHDKNFKWNHLIWEASKSNKASIALAKQLKFKETSRNNSDIEFSIFRESYIEVFDYATKQRLNVTESVIPERYYDTIVFDFGDVLDKRDKNYMYSYYDKNIDPNDITMDEFKSIIKGYFKFAHNKYGSFKTGKNIDDLYKRTLNEKQRAYYDNALECIENMGSIYDYAIPLLQSLRDKGYKLYYLTNKSKWNWENHGAKEKLKPLMNYFKAGIVSCDVGIEKPDVRIYKLLIKKTGLNPETTLFFDDKAVNTMAAEKVGLTGVVFTEDIVQDIMNLPPVTDTITEMTTSSSIDDNHTKGELMNLSSFKKIKISKSIIDKMKKMIKSLSHIRLDNTEGYIYTDKNNPVAVIVVETKENGEKWIQALEVFGEYKNHGLSKQLLDVAINELSATELSVNKKNDVAYSLYKKYGFKTKSETDTMYMMTLESNVTEAKSYDGALYRVTYDGEGIYNVIKSKVDSNTWKEMLSNDRLSWLPKPPEYTDTNVSYFTKKGFDKFTKTTMPLFSKYIENPKLMGLDKVNGIDNVVYSDDYQVVVSESVDSRYFENKDICHNLDSWEPNGNNILFVTGLSGGGKSTISEDVAKSYNAQYVSLDFVAVISMIKYSQEKKQRVLNKLRDSCPDAAIYFDDPNNIYTVSSWKNHDENAEMTKRFISWFMNNYSSNGNLYVIEGTQLFRSYDASFFKSYPIIVKGTSFIHTMVRRSTREYKDHIDEGFITAFKKFMNSFKAVFKKGYMHQVSQFNSLKRGMSKLTESESIGANTTGMKRSELPDEMFGIPSERKYELDTEKHVRSAIKLFNWVDPKYEKELATNIIKRMKYFNITDVNVGPKNRFGKYYKGGNKK